LYARPGLVRNVAILEDGTADVEVVYGTTKLKLLERKDDFFITKMSEMVACGLDRATRFDLDKIFWLPWSSDWFEPLHGGSSPVIGTLTAHSIKMLQITVSLRQARKAEAEIEPELKLGKPTGAGEQS
jgi:hypothetical protein